MSAPRFVRKTFSPPHTRGHAVRIAFFLLAASGGSAAESADFAAVKNARSGVTALKQLSMEELMDIEVTSVSKRPEKLVETPSAIQVVTDEDIRRFGATSIPEAL